MTKKIAFFHTTTATVIPMKEEFQKRYPDVQLISILEDGILPEVIANQGEPTPSIKKRLVEYGAIAQEQGAQAFVCMCTTLGIAIREAQKALTIPMISIDRPMLREAVRKGKKIGMLITFAPTKKASRDTILAFAEDDGKEIDVDMILVEGARDALNHGDKPLHDALIVKKAQELDQKYDVLVFAQATMLDAANQCTTVQTPILTSVASGMEQLQEYLKD